MAIPFIAPLIKSAIGKGIAQKAIKEGIFKRSKRQGPLSGVQITLNVENNAIAEFVATGLAFTSPGVQKAFWDRLARIEIQRIQNRLDRSVDVNGKKFQPLTASRIRQKGGNSKPLIDTGFLRKSFVSNSSDQTLSIISAADYADIHNEGIGVPQRQFVKYKDVELQRIIDSWSQTAVSLETEDPIDPRST